MSKQIKAEFLPRNDDIEVMFPEEEPEQMTAAEQAAQAAIEQLSGNAEKGKTIRIYRQLGSGKESMEFVAKYPADKFTVDDLIDKIKYEYGGGDYRFMIYNEKGKLVANKLVCIAKKSTLKPDGNNNDVYSVMSHMMDKQDEFMRRMMAGNNQNNSRMDFMQEMLMMKQLFTNDSGGNNGSIGQVKETLELMTMLKEEANPREDEGGGFTKMISEALPLFSEMAKASNNQARPIPQSQAQPNPQARQRTRKQPEENQNMNMQKMAISQLLAKCLAGEKPADVAEQIANEVPTAYIPQIEALVLGDNAFDKIKGLNASTAQHEPWFLDVIEWIKGYLGHVCQFDSEFEESEPVDNDSQTNHNVVNSTNEAAKNTVDGSAKQHNDGHSKRESGDARNT